MNWLIFEEGETDRGDETAGCGLLFVETCGRSFVVLSDGDELTETDGVTLIDAVTYIECF